MDKNNQFYTSIRNTQIVLYLLKQKGIRKVIASPGTQNMSLVVSMQRDSWFEMYSAADERSAAYMACGMAAESGEPVVLSCTGATASRNYVPGLTEAYYRHLPVVAITSTERVTAIGHHVPQIIDRSIIQKDIAKCSVYARAVYCDNDAWDCMIQVNKALLELDHHGKGPVHINLEKVDGTDYSVKELPSCRNIERYLLGDQFPKLPHGRIGIFVGAHVAWNEEDIAIVDHFCEANNAVVFCDQTSNYKGKYAIHFSLVASQDWYISPLLTTDLLIHIGEVSGDYFQLGKLGGRSKEVWRVSEDGEIKDTFKKMTKVFEMKEGTFFSSFLHNNGQNTEYFEACKKEADTIESRIPELPFSNAWIAQRMAPHIPEHSEIHFGVLNSLRSWNFFKVSNTVHAYCNVGGFGIDGGMSTLIGSSLAHPQQLHFGVFGDLAFFYDMNSLGNRHVGKNLRILLVNNAKGSEFKLYIHPASKLGDEADKFVAAGGHYGHQSPLLVKHYAEDLGFKYLYATNKEEFIEKQNDFLTDDMSKPILFEVFTSSDNESEALRLLNSIEKSAENKRKDMIKNLIGEENAHRLGRIIDKFK
jgi:2-succinyl-5-enolpyruvyl-6-hydroxy-3-cyclohexene-1-carboxylate synthase